MAVLLIALLASRSCASSRADVSQQEAIAIARKQLDFKPECVQIRYVRRGIPGRPFWAVSLWTLTPKGDFGRVAVVLVDAKDGSVGGVTNRPDVRSTSPQCESPV